MNIRKKGKWKTGEDKYVFEENRKYVKTLPPAKELFDSLCLEIEESPIKEEKIKEQKKVSEVSFNQRLSESPKQDGNGILRPSSDGEGGRAYQGVLWTCDRCGFNTKLLFEDKHCPKCRQTGEFKEKANKIMEEILQ